MLNQIFFSIVLCGFYIKINRRKCLVHCISYSLHEDKYYQESSTRMYVQVFCDSCTFCDSCKFYDTSGSFVPAHWQVV